MGKLLWVGLLLTWNAQAVTLLGNVPSREVENIQEKMDKIWAFESARFLAKTVTPPEIYFYEFNRAEEPPEFVAFQNEWLHDQPGIWRSWMTFRKDLGPAPQFISAGWIDEQLERGLPFPKSFVGLHYVGTNRLQLSPFATFGRYMINDPYGRRRDLTGYGFYAAAHEMLHYAFAERGVPEELHHCLFVTKSDASSAPIMAQIAEHLISEGYSSSLVKFIGYASEEVVKPCAALTEEQREDVRQVLNTVY